MTGSASAAPGAIAFQSSARDSVPTHLTIGQVEVWNAQRLLSRGDTYNIGAWCEIRGPVEVERLRNAFLRAMREGGSLCVRFEESAAGPRQIPVPDWHIDIPLLDFTHAQDPREVAHARMRSRFGVPFDPAHGQLVRFEFLQVAPECLILFFVAHHLATDHYGGRVILQRAAELYDSAGDVAADDEGALTPWSAVLLDEHHYRHSPQWIRDREYWQQQLADAPEPASLSGRSPAAPASVVVSAERVIGLESLDRFSVLLAGNAQAQAAALCAAVALYLAQVSGNDDVLLGMAVSGRASRLLRRSSGFLANVVPLRLPVTPDQTFRDLVREASRRLRGALLHQRYPAGTLRHDRGLLPGDPAIFRSRLNFIPADADASFGGHPARLHAFMHAPLVDDLSITVHALRAGEGTRIQFVGNSRLYDDGQIADHLARFLHWVDAAAAQPDVPLRQLLLPAADELRQLLEWGNGGDALSTESPLQRLALHAAQQPDTVAVAAAGRRLTYAELHRASNYVAAQLRLRGAGPGRVVALWADRSLEMLTGLLGIWKSGAAYVGFDPQLPAERLRLMQQDCQPALFVASPPSRGLGLSDTQGTLVVDLAAALAAQPHAPPDLPLPDRDSLAYLIYTSGSTGTPKAVLVTHRGLGPLAAAMTRPMRLGPGSRALVYATLGFDASVAEIVTGLWSAATLVLAPPHALAGPALQSLLREESITHASLTPTVLATLVPEADLPLRCLVVAGEACPPSLADRWSGILTLLNGYGPTECTVCTSMSEPLVPGAPICIGRPLPGWRVLVLGADLQPTGTGATGELYIAGVGLAQGYLGRPALTAGRFVADPFGPPGSRMYRSGDLVRWRADGMLEYIGRADQQVKLLGQRMELEEIEAALCAQPQVASAAVVLQRRDEDARDQLVAYVVASEGHRADAAPLRAALTSRLPRSMVPARFVWLGQMPRTSAGKLDRRALPKPAAVAGGASDPPVGEVEQVLATLWQSLLRVPAVGRNDNFFALGGDSLLLIQFAERVAQHGWRIDRQALLDSATIASIAARVEREPAPATDGAAPDLAPDAEQIKAIAARVPGGTANVQDIYPLAPLQEGMLVHHRTLRRDPYVLQALLEFDTRQRAEAFLRALEQVIARHDALRTSFHWRGLAQPVQVVYRHASLPVRWLASRGTDAEVLWKRRARRLNVTRAPLMHVQVMESRAQDRWWLMLQLHHLVVDHVSLEQVLTEVIHCMQGSPRSLAPPVPFGRFVALARREMADDAGHRAFFARMLEGCEPIRPFGIQDNRSDGRGVEEASVMLDAALGSQLRREARRLGITPAAIFHLAWARLLAVASGRHDVVFGTVLSGRLQLLGAAGGVVGLCLNTLPMRLKLTGAGTTEEELLHVHAQLAELWRHELAPVGTALAASGVPRNAPLFTSILNYRHDPMRLAGATRRSLAQGVVCLRAAERANYLLGVSVDDQGDVFALTAQAPPAVGAAQVCRMLATELEAIGLEICGTPAPDGKARPGRTLPVVPVPPAAHPGDHGVAVGEAPRTATEVELAGIWAEVLRTGVPDRHDDFFALGGDSLLALQVLARIRDRFGIEPSLKVLFDATTLAALAARIERLRSASILPTVGEVQPQRWTGPAPLSWSQERMWLIQSMDPQTIAYNMAAAAWLRGYLDVAAMCRAFDELVRRHEVLRTRVQLVDGEPRQLVDPWKPGHVAVTDLRGHPQAEDEAREIVTRSARSVFDLGNGPVFRASLIRVTDHLTLLGLVTHHIAGDQWSTGVIGRELASLYRMARDRRDMSLPPLAIGYRDYSAWQRSAAFRRPFESQLAYWRGQLTDVPSLNLPTDLPRPRLWTMNGALVRRRLPHGLLPAVDRVARNAGATSFMTLFAGFCVLLGRISGQRDFAVGVPVANRSHSSIEALVGTFVNTVVLRADLGGDPPFGELVRRVRELALSAFANQDAPFDRLVQEVGQRGDRSRAPLAQVMFNVVNAPMHGIDLDGLTWEDELLERGGSQFELSLTVDTERGAMLVLEYNSDLFLPGTIDRWADQYVTLLEAATADPQQRISQLSVVPASQLATLREWNATACAAPDSTFPRMFVRQASSEPDRIAVRFEGQHLDYGQLHARAAALAARLRESGAGRGEVVAVCMARSPELVVALLAVQLSGAAYLPLDQNFPVERLNYMLEDSGAKVLLGDADLPGGLHAPGMTCLQTGCGTACAAGYAGEGPDEQDPAYILYTSGSTGKPKGVVVPHGALANFLASMREQPGIDASDVLAAVTTVSFDIAGLELYLPLVCGACIELVPRATATDGVALRRLLEERGITLMQATPATWRMLVEAGWRGTPGLRALCGGEALSRPLANELLDRVGALWNMYGPTETTIWSTLEKVERGDAPPGIGRPIANTQVHVLDAAGALCPIGVAGEICIGGDGVALGYHRRPALTAERFVADRHSRQPGRRLYRTGDLGLWTADGRLQHLGRLDHQVKVRGFRIELGEVEHALAQHPAVRMAVASLRAVRPDDLRLVGYVVFRHGEQATVPELREFLRERLPEHALPAIVMKLTDIALTPNGKVDRAALPDPFNATSLEPDTGEPLATETERQLAAIWKSVLQVTAVGPTDNFFELGGHSLLSLRVARQVERACGRSFDPRLLFFKTLREIARQLDSDRPVRRWRMQ